MLVNSQDVGHCLAGMRVVTQPINHRHGRPLRQLGQMLMIEYPRHDRIHIARQHPRHIRDAFALTQPNFIGAEVNGMAAKLKHPHFK